MNKKGSILIVDDELIVRDSLAKWFREEGYEVGTADSAREALVLLAQQDLGHRAGGHQDAGRGRHRTPGPFSRSQAGMTVIIMTGYASVETAVAALKNGAYDYVVKPFDPEEIAHTVHNALAHRRAEQENAVAESEWRRQPGRRN